MVEAERGSTQIEHPPDSEVEIHGATGADTSQ